MATAAGETPSRTSDTPLKISSRRASERPIAAAADDPSFGDPNTLGTDLQHTVAGDVQARVDAENDHTSVRLAADDRLTLHSPARPVLAIFQFDSDGCEPLVARDPPSRSPSSFGTRCAVRSAVGPVYRPALVVTARCMLRRLEKQAKQSRQFAERNDCRAPATGPARPESRGWSSPC